MLKVIKVSKVVEELDHKVQQDHRELVIHKQHGQIVWNMFQ